MNNKDSLIKNLKLLANLEAGGTPAHSWLKRNRDIFLMQVKNSRQNLPVREVRTHKEHALVFARMFFKSPWMRQYVFRPSIIGLSSLAVVFTGWIASVSASINSVPGDMLYPLKRAAEAAQLTFIVGTENQTKLQVEFAARRLEEVSKITDLPDNAQTDEKVGYAMQEFKNNIESVKDNLEELKGNASPETVSAVAKMVDRKVGEYTSALAKAEEAVAENLKPDVESAKKAVEEAGVKAVEVMVAHTASVMSQEELKKKLEEKILGLEERVIGNEKLAASSTITAEDNTEAKKSLVAARTLIAADNLIGALGEVKNASKLILGTDFGLATSTPTIVLPTIVLSASSTVPTLIVETTTPRKLPAQSSSSTDNQEVNIQFIPDGTSLDWLEAQIMSQDFRPNDRPPEEDITIITK